MTAVTLNEIQPGLSVRLDTTLLRQLGGSQTNASPGPPDRAVQGPHQFLVVEVNAQTGQCLAVPLFSNQAPGSVPLDPAKMSGTLPAWLGGQYHYSVFQHWLVPLNHVVAASATEITHSGNRSSYAPNDQVEMSAISKSQGRNKFGFRPA